VPEREIMAVHAAFGGTGNLRFGKFLGRSGVRLPVENFAPARALRRKRLFPNHWRATVQRPSQQRVAEARFVFRDRSRNHRGGETIDE